MKIRFRRVLTAVALTAAAAAGPAVVAAHAAAPADTGWKTTAADTGWATPADTGWGTHTGTITVKALDTGW
jgi:hypothetical protein